MQLKTSSILKSIYLKANFILIYFDTCNTFRVMKCINGNTDGIRTVGDQNKDNFVQYSNHNIQIMND